MKLGLELYQLFQPIIADRRATPADDLATAAGQRPGRRRADGSDGDPWLLPDHLHGRPRHHQERAGGRHARPGFEPGRVREAAGATRSWCRSAVEEIVRWTSPVNYMKRTAARRRRSRRAADIRRRRADPLLCLGEPRRGRLRSALRLPRRPDAQPPRRLRPRGALLSRRPPGTPLAARALRRACAAHRARGARPATRSGSQASFVVGLKHLPVRYRIALGA